MPERGKKSTSGKPRAHRRDAHRLALSLPTGSALAHEDVDAKPAATGHVPKTQPFPFSADEGADVGIDNETAVFSDYEPASSKFTGQIESVTIAVSPSGGRLSCQTRRTYREFMASEMFNNRKR